MAPDDLFDDALVDAVLSASHVVARPRLEERLTETLADPGCRIVLVTGDPGVGKSVLLAKLAREHAGSLRYSCAATAWLRAGRTMFTRSWRRSAISSRRATPRLSTARTSKECAARQAAGHRGPARPHELTRCCLSLDASVSVAPARDAGCGRSARAWEVGV